MCNLPQIIKIRSVGASFLQERPPSVAATNNHIDELAQSFAKLLAELDAHHGPTKSWAVSPVENFAY